MSTLVLFGLYCAAQTTSVPIEIKQRIAVGRMPCRLALSSDGNLLYVTNLKDDSLSIIQTGTVKVVRTVSTCKVPDPIVFVTNPDQVIVGCSEGLMRFTPDGERLAYTTCCSRIRDLVWDGRSSLFLAGEMSGLFEYDLDRARLTRLDRTPAPTGLALSRDRKTLYVNYQAGGPGGRAGHDAIAAIAVDTGSRIRSVVGIPNVGGPLAVSPDGSELWANGTDACMSGKYDHVGCGVVPSAILNILQVPQLTLRDAVSLVRRAVAERITFSPDGTRVFVNGNAPVLVSAKSLEVIGGLPAISTKDAVFLRDGRIFATDVNTGEVLVLEVVR